MYHFIFFVSLIASIVHRRLDSKQWMILGIDRIHKQHKIIFMDRIIINTHKNKIGRHSQNLAEFLECG